MMVKFKQLKLLYITVIVIAIIFTNKGYAFEKLGFNINDDINFYLSSPVEGRDMTNDNVADYRIDNRLKLSYNQQHFKAQVHLLTSLDNTNFDIPINLILTNDDTNLFNLTNVQTGDNYTLYNKLDRFNIMLYDNTYQLVIGRDTVTWSRARIFHITDFFNPQVPGFYDGDYKMGTDLIHLNLLLTANDNVAFVINPRRDLSTHEVSVETTTAAVRYLHNNFDVDYSVILANYYNDYTLAGGISSDFIGGSIIRTDVAFWSPEDDRKNINTMLMVGVEQSFLLFNNIATFFVEYMHNDFGANNPVNVYNGQELLSNTMFKRVKQQEFYMLGQNYLSLGLIADLTTYTSFNYSNIVSLVDYSSFNFISLSYDYSDSLAFYISAGMAVGKKNQEFGQICSSNNNDSCYTVPSIYLAGFKFNL